MTDPRLELPEHARLAVLGSPIAHSRSPQIHQAAYKVLGLDWNYTAIECRAPELEARLAASGPEWRGFSVTMPLKEEARRLSLVLDPVAEESGVVNTLLRLTSHDTAATWAGFNTDVDGLAAALSEAGHDLSHTVILGAGATAVSAVLAVRLLGVKTVTILARRPEAATTLAARFAGVAGADHASNMHCVGYGLNDPRLKEEPELLSGASTIISTLPGHAAKDIDLPEVLLSVPLFDVAYDPWPSPLADRWRAHGSSAHSGIGMLVHQALRQLRIFLNGDPALPLEREQEVLDAMRRAAGANDLGSTDVVDPVRGEK